MKANDPRRDSDLDTGNSPRRQRTSLSHDNPADSPQRDGALKIPWPARSLERRRIFQELYQLFYQQVLHGCDNPLCRTPTCASQRKRRSKGSFRPYVASTARALAIQLASGDHPSRKLCPNLRATRHKEYNADCYTLESQASVYDLSGHKGTDQRTQLLQANAIPLPSQNMEQSGTSSNEVTMLATISPRHVHLEASQDRELAILTNRDRSTLARVMFHTAAISQMHLPILPRLWSAPGFCPGEKGHFDEQDVPVHCSAIGNLNTTSRLVRQLAASLGELSVIFHKTFNIPLGRKTVDCVGSNGQSAQNVRRPDTNQDKVSEEQMGFEVSPTALYIPKTNFYTLGLRSSREVDGQYILLDVLRPLMCKPCSPIEPGALYTIFPQQGKHLIGPSGTTNLEAGPTINPEVVRGNEWNTEFGRTDRPTPLLWCDKLDTHAGTHTRTTIAQSLTNELSSSRHLLLCFLQKDGAASILSSEFACMVQRFSSLHKIDCHPPTILSSLWQAIRSLDPQIHEHLTKSDTCGDGQDLIPQFFDADNVVSLTNTEGAHVAKIALAALVGLVQSSNRMSGLDSLSPARKLRQCGHVALPAAPDLPKVSSIMVAKTMTIMDALDDVRGHQLMKRLCKVLAIRVASSAMNTDKDKQGNSLPTEINIIDLLIRSLVDVSAIPLPRPARSEELPSGADAVESDAFQAEHPGQPSELLILLLEILVEWVRGVILKEWDGKEQILRFSAVGGALGLLSSIYTHYGERFIPPEVFETSFVSERLDMLETPVRWINQQAQSDQTHVLDFPFLFRSSTLVSYFRAINHASMSRAHQVSLSNASVATRLNFCLEPQDFEERGHLRLTGRINELTNPYLVLDIRRDAILTDAFKQLWRRHKRELLRPLKVRLGHDAGGEEGADYGGVQQEFFRIAIAEALDPKYGAFTIDPVTHMTWFQPGSLEPPYKYELLGILVSLAIYNGLTVPVTFPIALYMKILNHEPDHVEDIVDGWPDLARGLRNLRDWADGDVEDVFCRSYTFSVDVFGKTEDYNMFSPMNQSSSRSSSPDIPMVTNANRHQYIIDYVRQLTTHSVAAQYEPFAKGFKTVINARSLSLFTPNALQTLIQGIPRINTHDLEAIAQYEGGFDAQHKTVRDFWSIIHDWASAATRVAESTATPWTLPQDQLDAKEVGQAKVRQLLEFVTASDRLPVGGEARLQFFVQRDGQDDLMLPRSMTCFGRLLLPEYSSRVVMEQRLERAIEHSKGFGTA